MEKLLIDDKQEPLNCMWKWHFKMRGGTERQTVTAKRFLTLGKRLVHTLKKLSKLQAVETHK